MGYTMKRQTEIVKIKNVIEKHLILKNGRKYLKNY